MRENLKNKLNTESFSDTTFKMINAYCVGKGYFDLDEIEESFRDKDFERFVDWDNEQWDKEILMSIFDTLTETAKNTDDLDKIDLCIAQMGFLKQQFNLE